MEINQSLPPDDLNEQAIALVRTLHETERRLRELTGGEVDAVVMPAGESYLLSEAQEKLRQSEMAQREAAGIQAAILNALPAHIALIDPNGIILTVNESWRRFATANVLQSPKFGVGQNYLEVCEQATGECSAEAREAAIGIRRVLQGDLSELTIEYPCHSPSEQRWFRLMAIPVREDPMAGAVVMHVNITERKRATEALQTSEREQRQLAEQLRIERSRLVAAQRVASVGSWQTDLATMEVIWSDQTYEIFETNPDTFHPTHDRFLALVHNEDRADLQEAFLQSLNHSSMCSIEHRILTPNGRIKFVEERWKVSLDEGGKPVQAFGTCHDITERKKLESQFLRVQRMESIGTLAGGIAHDLNNTLAPILMAVEILGEKITDPAGREILATLEASALHGAELVKQVLTFARGIEGQRIIVNLVHLLHEIQKIIRDTFPKNIEFSLDPSRDLWTVTGDPTQLHQVFTNLCVNARDAMPHGGKLRVTMENVVLDEVYAGMNPDSKPGAYVVVKVIDTGTGMPPEIRDKIFEPFFTTKEIGKGTGLGLSTTMAIVKSHAGFINLYSEIGKGTTLKVYVPATNATAPETENVAVEQTQFPRGNGELVLVVDDEESIRKVAQATLERFGYHVLLAANGAEAVALYAQHRDQIDVVLTDMAMPIMDGLALIMALRVINPNVKVVGSSGFTSNGGVASALGAGVRRFVPKPYTAETILKVLAEELREPL